MRVAEFCESRNIKSLYHFTTIENYISILERRYIYSRNIMEKLAIQQDTFFTGDYTENIDKYRFDGLTEYINLSLSRPNWYLLEQYKKRADLHSYEWCILEITLRPMEIDSTSFAVCNAASRSAGNYGIKAGVEGLKSLFQDEVTSGSRKFSRYGLPEHFTTDIQAEVLVKDSISIQEIKNCFLPNESALSRHSSAFRLLRLPDPKFKVCAELFEKPQLK